MNNQKLNPKLRFTFDIEEEVPVSEFIIPLKKEDDQKKTIIIIKPKSKRNGRESRDTSLNNTGLF